MPWPVILTTLTLVLASAGLMFLYGLEAWQAFLMVGVAATGSLVTLMAILLLVAKRDDREETWHIFMSTFRSDLDLVLKYFRIKRK